MQNREKDVFINGAPRSARDPRSSRGVDVEANKRFLGLNPAKTTPKQVKMPSGGALSLLKMKDLVYFSQENAHRLGRLRKMHNDLKIPDKDGEFEVLGDGEGKAIGELDDMFNYQTRRYWNTMSSGFTKKLTKLLTEDDVEPEAVEEVEEEEDSSGLSDDDAANQNAMLRRNAMSPPRTTGRRSSDERRRSSIGDILRKELSKRRCTLLQSLNQSEDPTPGLEEKPKAHRENVRFQLGAIEDNDDEDEPI